MLEVKRRDVGQFEDLLVCELGPQGYEESVGYPPPVEHEAVGIGEDQALSLVVTGGCRPVWDRLDDDLVHVQGPQRLAVLGEDELATRSPAGSGLRQLAQRRVEEPSRALIETEPLDGMLEHVRHQGEYRPPVTRRSGGGARLCDRVASLEEVVVHDLD